MDNSLKNGEKLVIVGAGELAEIAYEYFSYDSPYEIVAFSAVKDYIKMEKLYDLPVVPFEEIHQIYPANEYKAFVAVPYTNFNRLRTRLYHETKTKGYELASYVSSNAFVWKNVTIGENCFIFENNHTNFNMCILIKIDDSFTILIKVDRSIIHTSNFIYLLDTLCIISNKYHIKLFRSLFVNLLHNYFFVIISSIRPYSFASSPRIQ